MGLFGRDAGQAAREGIENVIGASTTLTGMLRSDGGVRLDGTFEGNIEVAGNVVIGETGRLIGDVVARNVTVGGEVKGGIQGTGQVQVLSTGHVFGDIVHNGLMIDPGGVFQGMSRMSGYEQRALTPPADARGAPPPKAAAQLDDDTVEVTARPAGRGDDRGRGGQVREDRVVMPELDLDGSDIEPVIPDVVIEDVGGAERSPAGTPAPRNRVHAPPPRRR